MSAGGLAMPCVRLAPSAAWNDTAPTSGGDLAATSDRAAGTQQECMARGSRICTASDQPQPQPQCAGITGTDS